MNFHPFFGLSVTIKRIVDFVYSMFSFLTTTHPAMGLDQYIDWFTYDVYLRYIPTIDVFITDRNFTLLSFAPQILERG